MQNAFAIIHTWPDLKNAEYEVLQRVLGAADNIGADAVVIDDNGKVLWAGPDSKAAAGERLDPDIVEFVLSLHFLSPRVIDAYSYYTLWQPIEFYHDFGYQENVDKFATHLDLISCGSDVADAHALNLFAAMGRPPALPLPKMYHTLPEPFLEPRISADSRLFYIGINWERLGRPKGRFHDALTSLDGKDLIDIYGPEKVHGVAPWAGFESYRGELPFDGVSVKDAINRSGICLALSSVPHKNAGIMSNRLFEGLAGGAAVIATPNPLIDKLFRDVVYQVDDSRGEEVLGQQLLKAMHRIRDRPEEARERVLLGQKILREQCSIEGSLTTLFEQTTIRQRHFEASFLADAAVTVLLDVRGAQVDDVREKLKELGRQKRAEISLHIVCDHRLAKRYEDELAGLAGPDGPVKTATVHAGRFGSHTLQFDGIPIRNERLGPLVRKFLASTSTPFVSFMDMRDSLFADHFASLAKVLNDQPQAMFACSGMITRSRDLGGEEHRRFDSARFTDMASLLLVSTENESGRFLYRRELTDTVPEHLLTLLDDETHNYFRLAAAVAGPLAQSNYSSYVYDESYQLQHQGADSVGNQRQYIRDCFVRDTRWIEKLSSYNNIPKFVYSTGPVTPRRWEDYAAPYDVTHRIPLARSLSAAMGGEALAFMETGFSPPETEHSWLADERGILSFSLGASPKAAFESYELVLTAQGRRSVSTGREQHCSVAVNGKFVAFVRVPEHEFNIHIPIPPMVTSGSRNVRVEIVPEHAEPVFDENGDIVDPRRLSVKLLAISVMARSSAPPSFDVGTIYETTLGERGVEALGDGFHSPEHNLTWVAGCDAELRFMVTSQPQHPRLMLRLSGRRSLATGEIQTVVVKVNGRRAASLSVDEGMNDYAVDLPSEAAGAPSFWVELVAQHAEAVFDADRNVIDGRLLGVAIGGIGMFDCNPAVGGRLTSVADDGDTDLAVGSDVVRMAREGTSE
ncbi:hypothetical protein MMB232_03185 [Brevundimonas subvibrioides]|uniref:glycosyltransferase n=1 Tax=Brevundimonas subvibrioides TaxID=74313 RepID=UPI0032D58CC1